jgi:hypothetical protein
MLKKSLIFGSVALFVAALITLTGCPTSADDGSSTIVYGHRIYGWNVDPYQAQLAIDNAVKAGQPVILEDNLLIQPGELNFKNAQVRVSGSVTFTGGVMNMTDATVTWAPGAEISMLGGYYIHRRDVAIDGKVTPDAASVWFAEGPEDIMSTATKAAVRNFTLGSKQNVDYSRDSKGVDARITAEDLDTLFILEKLTIPSDAVSPSGDFTIAALGDADVTGNVATSVVVGGQRLLLGTCSTLTSSRGATIPVPGNPTIPNVRVEAERNIVLAPLANGSLNIPGKLTGPGVLAVGPNITDITVEGGDGNLIVSDTVPIGRQYRIGSTGRVVFARNVTVDEPSEIHGDVVFGSGVTTIIVSDSLALYGNVTLATPSGTPPAPQVISLSDGKALTLGADKTITLLITPQKSTQTIAAPLLAAGTDGPVVLTSFGTNLRLTVPASPKDDPEDIAEAQRIDVTGTGLSNAIEITDGTLQVLPGAIFGIDVGIVTKVDGSISKEFGYLTVAEGGTFALSTDTGGNTGYLFFDGLEEYIANTVHSLIEGPFSFKASGGAVTLGNRRIVGSAAGTKLVPEKGSTGSVFVQRNSTLLLEALELNVASYSGIAIYAGSIVALDKGAKITLVAGENGQATDWTNITNTSGRARLSGAFVGLYNPADAKQPVWSVAHKGGDLQAVNITATAGNPFSLGKSSKANFAQ